MFSLENEKLEIKPNWIRHNWYKLFCRFVYLKKILENFTSRAGCNNICNEKYYLWRYPSVDDMTMLREREIDQGNERFHSVRNIRERNAAMVQNTTVDPFQL